MLILEGGEFLEGFKITWHMSSTELNNGNTSAHAMESNF
jgi:hypothetical protein